MYNFIAIEFPVSLNYKNLIVNLECGTTVKAKINKIKKTFPISITLKIEIFLFFWGYIGGFIQIDDKSNSIY